jgi:thioredoxin-like negative regulator of GroEL
VNPMADQLFPPVIEAGLRLKRYDELEAILIRRLKNQPQYPVYFARGGLIRLIMARSRSEAMLAAAEKIADAGYTPRSAPPEFCAIYSDLMLARHKPDKARRLAEQGLVVNKNDPACLEALSRALRASGDTRKAGQLAARVASLRGETPQITALQRQVTATPGDAGARRALADALAGVRRWGEAHEHYAILARQSPGDRALRDLVAKSRMEAIRRLDTTPESEAAGGPSSGAA